MDMPRNKNIVALLLEHGSNPNHRDSKGCSVLKHAVVNASSEIVQLLLEHGAKIDNEKQLLHNAVSTYFGRGMNEGTVLLLLKQGVSLEEKDEDGGTPLHWAAGSEGEGLHYLESKEMVHLLLKKGANPNATNNDGMTPLMCHVNNKINDESWYNNGSPSEEIVKALLDADTDISIKDKDGETVVDYLKGMSLEEPQQKIRRLFEEYEIKHLADK